MCIVGKTHMSFKASANFDVFDKENNTTNNKYKPKGKVVIATNRVPNKTDKTTSIKLSTNKGGINCLYVVFILCFLFTYTFQ